MIAFIYHVFTRRAVVYVEHVLIPVPKLLSEFKHCFVTTAQWRLRERDVLPREGMPAWYYNDFYGHYVRSHFVDVLRVKMEELVAAIILEEEEDDLLVFCVSE